MKYSRLYAFFISFCLLSSSFMGTSYVTAKDSKVDATKNQAVKSAETNSTPKESKGQPSDTTYIRDVNNKIVSLLQQMEYLQGVAVKEKRDDLAGKIVNDSNQLRLHALELVNMTDAWGRKVEKADKQYDKELENMYKKKDHEFENLISTYEKVVSDIEDQLTAINAKDSVEVGNTNDMITTLAADTFEPNDTMTDAEEIWVGQIYKSYIYSAGDKDYYAFTPTQSTTINIQLNIPSTKDYDIKVYDSAGNLVKSGAKGTGETEDISFFVNARSKYYVYVLGYSNAYSSTSSYELKIVSLLNEIYPNSEIDVSLSKGIEQVYRFTPTQSGVHHITTSPYGGSGPSNNTELALYADEGRTNLIASNDDSHGTQFSHISSSLVAGTTYFLVLRHHSDLEGVYARLSLKTENRNIIQLQPDVPVDVSLQNGQYALFTFIPSHSGDYDIFTGPYGGNGEENDTYLELYADPNYTYLLKVDNDERDSKFSNINNFSMNANVPYYVKLRPYQNEDRLKTRITATLDPVSFDVLTINTPIDVSLPIGEEKVYQFTPAVTGAYQFLTGPMGGTGAANDTVLILYDNAYLQRPIASNDDANGQAFSEIMVTLTAGKTYFVKLRPYNSSISVNARLSVVTGAAVSTLALSKAQLTESSLNDGSFPTPLIVTLANGKFAADLSTAVTVNNLPPGLGVSVIRNSDTQLTLTFTGQASNHINSNDVPNASITIASPFITGATASVTSGLFAFDFIDTGSLAAYRYEYNEKNQLVRIFEKDILIMDFSYDGNGNLLTKTKKN